PAISSVVNATLLRILPRRFPSSTSRATVTAPPWARRSGPPPAGWPISGSRTRQARFAIWTDGYAAACGRSIGSTGRPPPDGTTCGYAVSTSATPADGAAAAKDTGGLPAPESSTWLCPTPTGIALGLKTLSQTWQRLSQTA